MWADTALTRRLGLRYPILLAPMAGGPSTPELVAAVSNAGGLGSLAAGYLTPGQLRDAIRRTRALTDWPFAVNLLVTPPVPIDAGAIAQAEHLLAPYRETLGLAPPTLPSDLLEPTGQQVQVLLDERVPVVSVAFGLPELELLAALKAQGVLLMGTATTVAEARDLESHGMDVVIAQGSEAGGHRGNYLASSEASLIGTMALVPQIVEAVRVPVVAAGGIMDGRGLLAALALGASAVQMGTAFLLADEAGTHPLHRQRLTESADTDTTLTRSFTGKAVRAIDNRFIREMRPHEAELPAYPIQHALTREIRRQAIATGHPELMGMWAGQAARLCRTGPAARLIASWCAEAEAQVARWAAPRSPD